MALDPIPFTDGDTQLRHTPLASMMLVREYGRILKRLDQGAIDTLSYLTANERSALLDGGVTANLDSILVLLRIVADLLGEQDLDAFACEYLQLGKVEIRVGSEWLSLAEHPGTASDPTTILLATWTVIGGLLRPLAERLRRLSAQAAGRSFGPSIASNAPSESELTPPTSIT
jgi:hypothetical protein